MNSRTRRPRMADHRLIESLEPRQMLASVNNFNDIGDPDVLQVSVSGSGGLATYAATPTGHIITIGGTDAMSEVVIQIVDSAGNNSVTINSLVIQGSVGSITLGNGIQLQADPGQTAFPGIHVTQNARKITVNGSIFASDIQIDGPSQANQTEITLSNAFGSDGSDVIGFAGLFDRVRVTSAGVIKYFGATNVNHITIQARWMITVNIDNAVPGLSRGALRGPTNAPGADIDIIATDAGRVWGVKDITITGVIQQGDWFINSPVQSILIDEVGFAQEPPNRGFFGQLNIDVNGRLGTLRAAQGDLFGRFGAASFGALTAADELRGVIGGFGTGGTGSTLGEPFTASIDSLRARAFILAEVLVTGGLKQLNADSIEFSDFDLGWLGNTTVSGANGMVNTNITLRTTFAQRSRALDTFTVSGPTSGTVIFAQDNNLGSLFFNGGLIGSRVLAGTAGGANFFVDPNPFASNRTIQSVRVKAPIGDAPAFGGPTVIAAFTIQSFQSTARHAANGGNDFGVVAFALNSVSVRRGNNAIFNTANASFTDPDSDFVIRIVL